MATNFPTSLDSFTNPSSSSTLDSPSHAAQHANINDAMEAVQAKLGTGAGTIGEWTTFTTSPTNISISSQDCVYAQVNEIIFARYVVTFAGAATGPIRLTTPTDMIGYASATFAGAFGAGLAVNSPSFAAYTMYPAKNLSGNNLLRFFSMDWGNAFAEVTTAVPFTWGSGDSMRFQISYTVA